MAFGKRGNNATTTAATISTATPHLDLARSLKTPKRGLLINDVTKIALKAKPVLGSEKPWAFCKKSDPIVPMLFPVKSRKLKHTPAAIKNPQRAPLGKMRVVKRW